MLLLHYPLLMSIALHPSAFQQWRPSFCRRKTNLAVSGSLLSSFFLSSRGPLRASSDEVAELSSKRPKVIVFDLDGCLWRPEMYELIWFSGGRGAPFRPDNENPGSLLTSAGEPVYLLGDVRDVMKELFVQDMWDGVKIGISSRTDEPNWARELLQKFEVEYGESGETFSLEDVFASGPVEIAKDSKVEHFRRIASSCDVDLEEILFFDNESGNCREVARLGVTVAYAPDGVTKSVWEVALEAFPQTEGKVIGVDIFGYDTLEGASRFF